METLRVALEGREYPIHIGEGLLDRQDLFAPHQGKGGVAIVTNPVVAKLYLSHARQALERAGAREVLEIIVPDGEVAKSWEQLDRIVDQLLAARHGRGSLIVALGGGVVGDLAGFAASIYQRGVPYIQVPTTLLAQVDSSVGGKTAINHARGKNMIGAFYQPRAVISDVSALQTLPERELCAGLAEVVKHGLILDAEFTSWLEANMKDLRARQPETLAYAVRRCCELKASVVAQDEREAGLRAILNLGHTFGHAIETGMGYGEWLHGEAVGAGMVMAAELSRRLGLIGVPDVRRVRDLVAAAGLPVTGPNLPFARYLELMAVDKKAEGGSVKFVVLEAIGRAGSRSADEACVREAVAAASPA